MPDAELPDLFIDRSVGLGGVPAHFRAAWPAKVRTIVDVFGPGKVPDEDWMRRCDEEGWIAVCKDDKIRRKPGERELMSQGTLRVFCLTNGQLTRDRMVEHFARAHDRLVEQAREPGPWMLGIYSAGRAEVLTLYPAQPAVRAARAS